MPKTPTEMRVVGLEGSLLSPGWIFLTRNRNNPIARAELYQLSYIPPDASKVSGRRDQAEQMPRRRKTSFSSSASLSPRKGESSVRDKRLGEAVPPAILVSE